MTKIKQNKSKLYISYGVYCVLHEKHPCISEAPWKDHVTQQSIWMIEPTFLIPQMHIKTISNAKMSNIVNSIPSCGASVLLQWLHVSVKMLVQQFARIHSNHAPLWWEFKGHSWITVTMGQGPVLLTFLRHVARISANGIAAFKESCAPIG